MTRHIFPVRVCYTDVVKLPLNQSTMLLQNQFNFQPFYSKSKDRPKTIILLKFASELFLLKPYRIWVMIYKVIITKFVEE